MQALSNNKMQKFFYEMTKNFLSMIRAKFPLVTAKCPSKTESLCQMKDIITYYFNQNWSIQVKFDTGKRGLIQQLATSQEGPD